MNILEHLQSTIAHVEDTFTKAVHSENIDDAKTLLAAELKGPEGTACKLLQTFSNDNKITEMSLRRVAARLIQNSQNATELKHLLDRLLDLSFWMVLTDITDASSMPLLIMQDVNESCSLKVLEEAFSIFESKHQSIEELFIIKKPQCFKPIIKFLTEVRTRISKQMNTALAGSIALVINSAAKLCDKSVVNLMGNTNKANKTNLQEDSREIDALGQNVDRKLHQTFWSLQTYLQNPDVIFTNTQRELETFVAILDTVLTTFEQHNLPDFNGSLDDEQSNPRSSSLISSKAPDPRLSVYFTKFLTSSRLLSLEFQDWYFRRHVLVQVLIACVHIRTATMAPGRAPVSQRQKQTLADFEKRVYSLLEKTGPNAKHFRQCVEHVLERENNWALWKKPPGGAEKCKPFDRDREIKSAVEPVDASATTAPRKRKAQGSNDGPAKRAATSASKSRQPEWNLARLGQTLNEVVPTVDSLLGVLREEADPENGVEEAYRKKHDKVGI